MTCSKPVDFEQVEELDRDDSVPVFCGSPWGQWDLEFFACKIFAIPPISLYFGSLMGVPPYIAQMFLNLPSLL